MIYCFSGTGNSLYVAGKLLDIDSEDSLGFVFPIYAWGVPSQVRQGIIELGKSGSFVLQTDTLRALGTKVATDKPYVYAVMTCGDDMGFADKELAGLLKEYCGLNLNAAFSVQMPNTYVCLPGFDIDSDEVADGKVKNTLAKLPEIKEAISSRKDIISVHRGVFPYTKSYVMRQVFEKFLITDKYFQVDQDLCISCGKCEKSCPRHNIKLVGDEKKYPVWNGDCCNCLGCYHSCPKHAINWGRYTKNKGQKKKL